MEYNKESFKKALKESGIIRWENHFEKVVKAYLKAEAEQLTISGVVVPKGTLPLTSYYRRLKIMNMNSRRILYLEHLKE